MTKAALVDHVAATVQLPKHQTAAVLTGFLQGRVDALHGGDQVACVVLGASVSVTARRVQDATHAQAARSRSQPKRSPR